MTKYYYIYKTTNLINSKIYVGQRSCNCLPEYDIDYLGSGVIFIKALKKYGKENFKKEVIEAVTIETINDREIYWIAEFKSNVSGYNITKGGLGIRGFKHSPETKKRWSEKRKGKPSTNKGKKMSEPQRELLKNRKFSEESKRKMKEAQQKFVYAVMCPNKKVIKIYNLLDFAEQNGLSDSVLLKTLQGIQKNGRIFYHNKGYVLLIKKNINEIITDSEIAERINWYNSLNKSRKSFSESTKKNMSLSKIGKPNLKRRGFKYSDESRLKMSVSQTKRAIRERGLLEVI